MFSLFIPNKLYNGLKMQLTPVKKYVLIESDKDELKTLTYSFEMS